LIRQSLPFEDAEVDLIQLGPAVSLEEQLSETPIDTGGPKTNLYYFVDDVKCQHR
jgi:hypothetical protein